MPKTKFNMHIRPSTRLEGEMWSKAQFRCKAYVSLPLLKDDAFFYNLQCWQQQLPSTQSRSRELACSGPPVPRDHCIFHVISRHVRSTDGGRGAAYKILPNLQAISYASCIFNCIHFQHIVQSFIIVYISSFYHQLQLTIRPSPLLNPYITQVPAAFHPAGRLCQQLNLVPSY